MYDKGGTLLPPFEEHTWWALHGQQQKRANETLVSESRDLTAQVDESTSKASNQASTVVVVCSP